MFKNIAPKGRARTVRRARRLRREMSLPEILLWQVLRMGPGDLKFRRQHPTGPYSLDFFCSDARLAIEVDGEAHDRGNQPARDEARDSWLFAAGIETMRIPAAEVLGDLDAVVQGVIARAGERLPLHHPAKPGVLRRVRVPRTQTWISGGNPKPQHPPRDKLGED